MSRSHSVAWEADHKSSARMLVVGHAIHGEQVAGASLTPKGLDQDLKPAFSSAASRTGEYGQCKLPGQQFKDKDQPGG